MATLPIALTAIYLLAAPPTTQAGHGWQPKSYRHSMLALNHRGGSSMSEHPLNKTQIEYSTYSVPGERRYMEDEFYISSDGTFAAVFDGHGGKAVSRYLRQNLYANYQAAYGIDSTHELPESIISSALLSSFDKVDLEVQNVVHWSFQGSTACAVVIHENTTTGKRSIISANLGDSRAILSRNGMAIDLTEDHKPNNKLEKERIEALGGSVDWCGELDNHGEPVVDTGVYRINGNLALSRAIGDRSERPFISSTPDICHGVVDEDFDTFVLLATDGLFDVMTSQEVVSLIHEKMDNASCEQSEYIRKNMAKFVVEEALELGTLDNVTVLILWIK